MIRLLTKCQFNAFIQLEAEAIGTSFAAGNATRDAMAAQTRGNEWMIFTNSHTGQEYWDFVSCSPLTQQLAR